MPIPVDLTETLAAAFLARQLLTRISRRIEAALPNMNDTQVRHDYC